MILPFECFVLLITNWPDLEPRLAREFRLIEDDS
jgi:hypothetical protein